MSKWRRRRRLDPGSVTNSVSTDGGHARLELTWALGRRACAGPGKVNLRAQSVKGLLLVSRARRRSSGRRWLGAGVVPPAPGGRHLRDRRGRADRSDASAPDRIRIATALSAERGYPISVVTIRSLGAPWGRRLHDRALRVGDGRAWKLDADRGGYGLVLARGRRGSEFARIKLGSAWAADTTRRFRHVMDGLISPRVPARRALARHPGWRARFRRDGPRAGAARAGAPLVLIPRSPPAPWVLVAAIVSLAKAGAAGSRGGRPRSWARS